MKGPIKIFLSIMYIVGGIALAGCSDTTTGTRDSGSTTTDNSAKIIKEINTNCGDSSCI